jgi:hypothetical protein
MKSFIGANDKITASSSKIIKTCYMLCNEYNKLVMIGLLLVLNKSRLKQVKEELLIHMQQEP